MSAIFVPTIALFFYAYFLVVFIFTIFSLLVIYHLLRFGFFSLINIMVIVIYLAISFVLISNSLTLIYGFDWSTPLLGSDFFNNVSDSIGSIIQF